MKINNFYSKNKLDDFKLKTKIMSLTESDCIQLVSCFLDINEQKKIIFKKLTTPEEFSQLSEFRLRCYSSSIPYMLSELNNYGFDKYDANSLIFAAIKDNSIIASIRLTSSPFEVERFIDKKALTGFLDNNWHLNYLEWSRLLIDRNIKITNMSYALICYAGLQILKYTSYQYYIGYTKKAVRRKLSKFSFDNNFLSFKIPTRGCHDYLMLKGCFLNDFKILLGIYNMRNSKKSSSGMMIL